MYVYVHHRKPINILLYLLSRCPLEKGSFKLSCGLTSQTPGLRLLFVPALGIAGGKICSKDLE